MSGEPRALLDNTVMVDWFKSPGRRNRIDNIVGRFPRKYASSICLLEFKATLIEQCILLHARFQKYHSYSRVVDASLASNHPQVRLREHILRNMVNVAAISSFDMTPETDERYAEECRLQLENVIPFVYHTFLRRVDEVLKRINCSLAMVAPRKPPKRATFEVNLPRCRSGETKTCRVEEFIRQRALSLVTKLHTMLP
jgi:hypothetical protein